jgi:hypothetical protein
MTGWTNETAIQQWGAIPRAVLDGWSRLATSPSNMC